MAYWGYLGFIKGYLSGFGQNITPKILEIGVDKGQTFIPLTSHLVNKREKFQLTGVDIKIEPSLAIILEMMSYDMDADNQTGIVLKDNSLKFLKRMNQLITSDEHFNEWGYWDLVLLDGDQNYYTVSRELEFISKQLTKTGIIIIDDYDGRWAEKDEYFSEVEGYENHLSLLDKPEDTQGEKRGVKTAVLEFVKNNPEWKLDKRVFPKHTPVLMYREEHVKLVEIDAEDPIEAWPESEKYRDEAEKLMAPGRVVLAFKGSKEEELASDRISKIYHKSNEKKKEN